jgi:hypothetical protein
MKARVYVTLKPSVFDPQGRVVADALVTLGYPDVKDVRRASSSKSNWRTPIRRRPSSASPRWPTSCSPIR